MPFTHSGDVNIVAHPHFPNLYGYGYLNVAGNVHMYGDLTVDGTISGPGSVIDESVSAIKISDQSIPSGSVQILTNWDTSDTFRYNTGSFDLTTGTWTAAHTGKFEFNLHLIWDNTSSTVGVRQVRALYSSGGGPEEEVTMDRVQPFPDTSIFVTQRLNSDLRMQAGDTLRFECYQNSGSTVDVDQRTTLTIKKIF